MDIPVRVLEGGLLLGSLLLLIPGMFLLVECLAASRRVVPARTDDAPLPRTALLIPAHNEEAGLATTLAAVRAAAFPRLEILVIADNCTDATAAIARHASVRVLERRDPVRIGKGYALAFGIDALSENPPDVVIVLDADCTLDMHALERLARGALVSARPAQAIYTLRSIPGSSSRTALSNFAFMIKNRVRPLGLTRLGAPCLLTGSGMAFPWAVASQHSLASGHLSEDMWLSVQLACAGYAPRLCEDAFVYGEPPRRNGALKTQRTRWERGHLQTMRHGIPRLLYAAWTRKQTEPLWLALELSIPPLALLALLVTILFMLSLAGVMLGMGPVPLAFALVNLTVLVSALMVAWWNFGRADLPAQTLLAVPAYILWKIPLHLNTLLRTRVLWTRTGRDTRAGDER